MACAGGRIGGRRETGHTYKHTTRTQQENYHTTHDRANLGLTLTLTSKPAAIAFGLYKILFYFDAFVYDSIIRSLPPPTCIARTIAIPLYVHCATYDAPPDPAFVCHTAYNIGNGNIV